MAAAASGQADFSPGTWSWRPDPPRAGVTRMRQGRASRAISSLEGAGALPGACLSLGPHCPRWSRNVVGHDYFLILLKFALHSVLCWLTGKRRFARCRCPGAWGSNRMDEDKRTALPRRVPHAGGPRIPHGSPPLPPEPLRRPRPGPGVAARLAQLRSEAGTPMGQEAGTAGGQAEPGYRSAFEPVRPASASLRPRVRQDTSRPAVQAPPSWPDPARGDQPP